MAEESTPDVSLRPGSINLIACMISNYDGSETRDLRPVLYEFNVYRSIFSPYIRGNIVISDALALTTRLPIIGEEGIQLTYQTPTSSPQSKENEQISIQGRVVSITRTFAENVRNAMYRIDFVSQYRLVDLMTVVRKSFGPEPISDMVKKMLKESLNIAEAEIEQTKGKHKFVIPTWSPFQTMHFFCREAMSAENEIGNFVFYEDHDKHYFKTIDAMLQKGPTEETKYYFRHQGIQTRPEGSQEEQIDPWKIVEKVDIKQQFDLEKAIQNGMYDNKVLWVDTILQQYEAVKIEQNRPYFNYKEDFSNFEHTAEYPHRIASDKALQMQGKGDSHIRFIHSNPNQNWYRQQVEPRQRQQKLPYVISSLEQIGQIRLDLVVPGHTNRKLGEILDLELHEMGATDDVIGELHRYLKGRWLTAAIRDVYITNKGFSTHIEACKTAFESEVKNEKGKEDDGGLPPVQMPPLPPDLTTDEDPDPQAT